MESIREIGMLLCIIGIGTSVMFYLLPKTAASAAVKAAVGVVFCVILCQAVAQKDFTMDFDFASAFTPKVQTMEYEAIRQTLTLTENAVADQIYGALKKQGYPVQSVSLDLHITEENSIRIDSMVIKTAGDALPIKAYIENTYGITPHITVNGERE